jgi:hypothetical protein
VTQFGRSSLVFIGNASKADSSSRCCGCHRKFFGVAQDKMREGSAFSK